MTTPNPLTFVTGLTTFEVHDLYNVKKIGKGNCIQSERFTVGGYEWVAEFYPEGIDELVPKEVTSVSVRVMDATEEVWVRCIFEQWNWPSSSWDKIVSSNLITLQPSGDKARCSHEYAKFWTLIGCPYEKDQTLRIKCILLVIPRPLSPLIGYRYKPAGNGICFCDDFHTASYAPPNIPSNEYTKLPRQPTVRFYCEANKDFSVTIRNGIVVMAPADSNDYYQHWIKDMTYGDKVKDEDGFPAFALVNRVTGEALQNPAGENEEVTLVPYNPNRLKDSVMWTEVWSPSFHVIRIADATSLNLTAVVSNFNISDGAKIVVQKSVNAAVQRWKIIPYNSNIPY